MSQRQPAQSAQRIQIDVLLRHDPKAEIEELLRGLSANPPWMHPRWFYDDEGCRLFEAICELPEYYQTRTEARLLRDRADEIVAAADPSSLVELGAGSAIKSRILLDAMKRRGNLALYGPLDVNESMIERIASELIGEYPNLHVHGVVANFTEPIPSLPQSGRRLVIFLGGTIGNFDRPGAARFLNGIQNLMDPEDCLLLGVDLIKDRRRLIQAYDDAQGVTAAFNKNALRAINRALGSDFDPDAFEHVALYDDDKNWIEMRLRAKTDQCIRAPSHAFELHLLAGDELHTEISAKYDEPIARDLLTAAGFELIEWMTDDQDLFGLALARKN